MLWENNQNQKPPFGEKPRQRSFTFRVPFIFPESGDFRKQRLRQKHLARALVRIYHGEVLRRALTLEQYICQTPQMDPLRITVLRRWYLPYALPAWAYAHPLEGLRLCRTRYLERRRQQVADARNIFGADHPYLPRDPLVGVYREALEKRLGGLGELLSSTERGPVPLSLQMWAFRSRWFDQRSRSAPASSGKEP